MIDPVPEAGLPMVRALLEIEDKARLTGVPDPAAAAVPDSVLPRELVEGATRLRLSLETVEAARMGLERLSSLPGATRALVEARLAALDELDRMEDKLLEQKRAWHRALWFGLPAPERAQRLRGSTLR